MKPFRTLFVVIFILILSITACTKLPDQNAAETGPVIPEKEGNSDSPAAAAVVVDLSSPPPGSNATQDKWDTFTDEKKQESWDKFLADSAPSETAPAAEATAE